MFDEKQSISEDGIEQNDIEKFQINLEEIQEKNMALDFVQEIITDADYVDWKTRIPEFLEKGHDDWSLFKIIDKQNKPCGFFIVSSSLEKMNRWNEKFVQYGWIDSPIDIETSVQVAYLYIQKEQRSKGYGEDVLEMIKEIYKERGKKKIYGFSRYERPMSLYKKTGAKILNQERKRGQLRSYFYWDLEEGN